MNEATAGLTFVRERGRGEGSGACRRLVRSALRRDPWRRATSPVQSPPYSLISKVARSFPSSASTGFTQVFVELREACWSPLLHEVEVVAEGDRGMDQ